ncbi:hypothetical protein GN241_15175 [Rhodobacteraceae bacterium IMCC1335]
MKVGRITIGEFKSADDMEALISSHRAAVSTVLSTCETTILVKTSPQSFLNLKVLNKNQNLWGQMWGQKNLKITK